LKLEISHIECYQLRTSKCSGEANEQQRSISYPLQIIGQQAKHDTEIFNKNWRFLICSCSVCPLDAFERLGYEYVVLTGRREASRFMRFANGAR
jgi:hypothetical protein